MSGGSVRLQQELRSRSQQRTTTATFRDAFTGVQTPLDIQSGQVTVSVEAANRRMLDLTLPPRQSTFDMLSSPGGEITVVQTFRYIDNNTEPVPLGVFCVNTQAMNYTPDNSAITLQCPDRWWRITSNGFGAARSSVASNAAWQEIKRLIEAAWPNVAYPFPGWASIAGTTNPDQSATTKVGSQVWTDGDRDAAIRAMLAANALDFYFDASGLAVLRPIPTITSFTLPVWTVNPGPAGVLKDATRTRDMTDVHNVVVLSTSASDVILPIVEVANTRAPGTDPLSSLGPLGRVVLQVSDPNFRTTGQMTAAGKVILNKQLSVNVQLDAQAISNPCLDGYDVVQFVLPRGDAGTQTPAELHQIASCTIPLMPDGSQDITVRATRSTADDTV